MILKAYHYMHGRFDLETVKVKNAQFRWYTTTYQTLTGPSAAQRRMVSSIGSNALTHWGAIREARKYLNDLIGDE